MTDTRAFDADLRGLVEREGPFVSVYLDTEARTEEGPEEIALRWRALREKAAEAGADDTALDGVDALVRDSHLKGDGLVALTAGSEVVIRRYLPSPIPDAVKAGPLPLLIPYLEWQQDNPRYAVVLSDRVGADIFVVGGFEVDETVSVEGDTDPITKVNPGGWSQRRYQQRAENTWEANAKLVAQELERLVKDEELAFVVIAGDVRSASFLREHLSHGTASLAVEVKGEPVVSIDEIRDRLESEVAAYVGQTTHDLLAKFQEERGQNDLATDGLDATVDALRKSQVDTLVLARDGVSGTLWFSVSDLGQVATDKGPLTDLGIGDVAEGDAADVLVRAALGTGARIAVVPSLSKQEGPTAGVGALLRYA